MREPEKLVVHFRMSSKFWEPGGWCLRGIWVSMLKQMRANLPAIPSPFCSIQALSVLDAIHSIEEDNLLYSVYQSKCWSLPEIPFPSHLEIHLTSFLGILVQSCWHMKLSQWTNVCFLKYIYILFYMSLAHHNYFINTCWMDK